MVAFEKSTKLRFAFECVSGEFVWTAQGLAMVWHSEEWPILGIFEGVGSARISTENVAVLQLGENCVIEPDYELGQATEPLKPGALTLGKDGFSVCFSLDNGKAPILVNLATGQRTYDQNLTFRAWRLWASMEDYNHGRRPLLVMAESGSDKEVEHE